jgi:HAD superfamily hydrolase (TIGR01509 family)
VIKSLVFDFDGVIVDSEKYWLQAKVETLEKIGFSKKEIKYKSLGISSQTFFIKNTSEFFFNRNKKKILKQYKKFNDRYKKILPKTNHEIIKLIKINKFENYIISNNSKEYIFKILDYYNLNPFFKKKNIICLRLKKIQKPSPLGYKKILNKYKRTEVIVIEDSEAGITAANKAKIKYIFKYQKKISNLRSKIFTFKKANDILKIIDQINNK